MSLTRNENKRLPFLKCTEHFMPMGNGNICGTGYTFTHTVSDGLRAGGLWLVMQDDSGQAATNDGDIIMFAAIEDVDWLSESQIKLKLTIEHWGRVTSPETKHQKLEGQLYPLWQNSYLPMDDILVVRLIECTHQFHPAERHYPNRLAHEPAFSVAHVAGSDHQLNTNWVCWRWLEILPITLDKKQRLLKSPDARLCIRYLKRIIRQSDRFN
ncbi:hypothetical protein LRP52_07085 [Photobacterium sp. ZSDE20]|uniref:Lon protease n=1 Tax=Photobacterium pectinilyticum TaxID=2906793 RepID=A0ABT1N1I5_9GAMM|nr:hypothetical protein [Photobacterium sp. ZSDE20]MCQ1057641.1 hypothetical protein [Photobacterium sp. ZSDE20]MDD1821954.1 hypothetical protein [Photobacterium sp. ZSDE20]